MIFGFSTFVFIHVVISLVGIFTGFVVLFGWLAGKRLDGWTATFLLFTVATSVTGFFLPAEKFMPSHVVGIISLVALALAIFALYSGKMLGGWRPVYLIAATAAQYFNVFVLVAQLFAKVPALKALAPTQSEPPFAIAQGFVLVAFVALGILAVKRFQLEPPRSA
jgi:hypothetical protein